jgi:hypothetical protein
MLQGVLISDRGCSIIAFHLALGGASSKPTDGGKAGGDDEAG